MLSAILGILDSAGKRIATTIAGSSQRLPAWLKLGAGLTASAARNGPDDVITLAVDPAAAGEVQPTPDTLALRGGDGEVLGAYFSSSNSSDTLTGVPSVGLLRFPPSVTQILTTLDGVEAGRTKLLLRWISNALLIGASTNQGPKSIEVRTYSGGRLDLYGEGSGGGYRAQLTSPQSWARVLGGTLSSVTSATIHESAGTLTTTDATPTTIASITLADGTYAIDWTVTASGGGAFHQRRDALITISGGALSTVTSDTIGSDIDTIGTGGAALSYSGGALSLVVTGLSGSVVWKGRIEAL